MAEKPLVAVTGASGYIALHIIRDLLAAGYAVRGTLRDATRGDALRAALGREVAVGDLSFVTANLMSDDGWAEAVAGCTYVMHVASPLPKGPPKDENELIVPAREGALRVLKAAADAGAQRVVMTSSIAAVISGHEATRRFNEDDWSDLDRPMGAYPKSKTIAEKAAWDFIAGLPADTRPELVTINPSLVLGPLIDPDGSASVEAIRKLMAREAPGCPRLGFALVDVRDVAAAHIAAMTSPKAAGNRYVCSGEFMWLRDIAHTLHSHVQGRGYKIPKRPLPDWVVRIVALFDKTVRLIVDDLGKRKELDTRRIQADLGWHPRPVTLTINETADSLIAHGVV
jgi:nucleoside-diphosphate-sugar epimerase